MSTVTRQRIPPLENGDRLSREEFERRYDAMPGLKKAELIEGVVYMPSPVRADQHGGPHFDLLAWLGAYRCATPGVVGADNSSIRLDIVNMPQPDCTLFIHPSNGGQARISHDGYIENVPELVGEIAASSVSYDLTSKLVVYRRNGVREYIVWRVLDEEIDWFQWKRGRYVRMPKGNDGILRSKVFPGLWLDPAALIRGEMATVTRVLQQGLDTPEHADFVARLAAHPTA